MWAYNSILTCAVTGRVPVLPVLWKKSSFSRFGFSTATMQTLLVPARKPSAITSMLSPSVRKNLHSSKCLLSESSSNLAKDVVLFKFDNVRLFKLITLFGCVNFVMFMTISLNIFTLLSKQASEEEIKTSEFESDTSESSAISPDTYTPVQQNRSWDITSLFSRDESADGGTEPISSNYILTALCGVTFALGYGLLAGTYIYCNHVVRFLVLRKCGKQVTVITHGMFGNNRVRTWNLNEVNVRGNRAISSAVLISTKGKYFSYILDNRGTYTNPQLFDATVAIPRSL